MSSELKNFLLQKGISSSRTTSYNPAGNGQVECLNGTVWKAISLALKTRGLPVSRWQDVLHDALHSIRSLLCTATNATPHERLFTYQRRSTSGTSVPTWLTSPGPVLLKRHVRNSKFEPLVDEVELIEANPQYAHVRFPDGREDTVSIKHLAPQGDTRVELQHQTSQPQTPQRQTSQLQTPQRQHVADIVPEESNNSIVPDGSGEELGTQPQSTQQSQPLRRSERLRKAPDRLNL